MSGAVAMPYAADTCRSTDSSYRGRPTFPDDDGLVSLTCHRSLFASGLADDSSAERGHGVWLHQVLGSRRMAAQRFPLRIGRRSAPFLRVIFGVKPAEAIVTLTDDPGGRFGARFGWAHIETPIGNIVSWRIEGPWAWATAIGVRVSVRHRDVTFGGSPRGGVRVDFKKPPKLGRLHVPALYVTVEDLDGLAAALTDRGIPGEDARTKIVP